MPPENDKGTKGLQEGNQQNTKEKHMKTLRKILFALCLLTTTLARLEEINLIDSVTVNKNILKIAINKGFKEKYLTSNFFAEYDRDIDLEKLDYSIQIMPFIMNVVSIIWISGRDYYIDSMDEELSLSLEKINEVFRRMYKKTQWNGRLIPRKLVKNTLPFPLADRSENNYIALLYSGGVDSTASSFYHRNKKQLLITVWGHWDLPLEDEKLWKIRAEQLRSFGKKYGHENTFIKSNYYSFLNRPVLDKISPEISSWRIFTVEGIGWAGLAAPLMLLKGYPELRHGSTVTWDFDYPAAANPFVDDNIHFSGAWLKHDLFDLNRLEKCAFIRDVCKKEHLEKPLVRVCEKKIVENCCTCQKCVRTMLEFIVIGENPQDYGFALSPEIALKESKKFMDHHTSGYTTVWHFMHLQELLRKRLDNGESIPHDLEWILSVDLSKKITTDVKYQHKIDWNDFADLLPEITIPAKKQNLRKRYA